ncbi:MAG: hypothetical protein H6623_02795 [Bdellovibrionaceae bacterium]|nr:hypothetical protein [Pseudobdellovibrionaceae bacterium]
MKTSLYIILSFIMWSNVAWSKSFYLTVRRDYSSQESPEVELIYNSQLPLRLRLLKPKNMDAFIKEQIDLRRAWKQPSTQTNSARSLLIGFNKTKLDVNWIRYHFNSEIRQDVAPSLGGAPFSTGTTNLVEGPNRLIRAPDNFEVVSDYTMSPDAFDVTKPFDIPGFGWYTDLFNSYKTRLVKLPAQAHGFYVLQAIQGNNEGQVVVVINDIKAMLQQTDGLAVVYVTTRSGKPLSDAKIKLRNVSGDWINEKKTNTMGVAELTTDANTELIAAIESPSGGAAIIDTEFLSTEAQTPDVFIYTDRPMYKPEGVAQFKAIVREKERGISELLTIHDPLSAALYSATGNSLADGTVSAASEFGSFYGEIPLSKTSASGLYQVQTTVNGLNYVGEIRVKEYKKPIFYVDLSTTIDSVKAGQKIPLKIKAENYAGGIPTGLTAQIEVLRVRYDGPEWIEDAGLSEKANDATYGWGGNETVPIIPLTILTEENIAFSTKGTLDHAITLPAQLPGDKNYDYKILVRATVMDADGNVANASKSLLEAEKDFMLQARSSAIFVEKDQKAWLEVRALTPGGQPLGQVTADVEWFHIAYGKAPQSIEKQKISSDAKGKITLSYPTTQTGIVRAKLTVISSSGTSQNIEEELLVADSQSTNPVKMVSDMTILSRRNVYTAGEQAKALVLLPEHWGVDRTSTGFIYTTIAGKKIFKTNAEKISGQSYWVNLPITEDLGSNVYVIIAYSDPVNGFVERRLQYQIVPVDKMLKLTIVPEESVIAPGMEQAITVMVKDYKNQPVYGELSLSVVDRAVLDLQPEFRPQLLEFFYPKDRLNLMTFYSSEFQSYGYGESIASMFKPNYWFAATKPSEEIKPEKDTAYWNPAVVTDSDGKATVKFRLPVNQTIWRVTAVAIDKKGRFGEAHSEFKAQTETPIQLAMPDKIRKGESFMLRVGAQNLSSKKTAKFKLQFKIQEALKNKEELVPIDIELKPGDNKNFNVFLESDLNTSASEARVEVFASVDGVDRSFSHSIKLLDGYNHSPLKETFPKTGHLQLTLAKHEHLTQPSIRVFQGLSGAIVPAMHWMASYPYGCIEQLTNTTLPNLAIAEIFDSTLLFPAPEQGFFTRLFANLQNFLRTLWHRILGIIANKSPVQLSEDQIHALQRAVKNAHIGVEKINSLQLKSGYQQGLFQWFDGVEVSFPMQYYVMLSLVSVENPEFLKGIDLVSGYKALQQFAYDQDLDSDTKNILNRYIRSRLVYFKLLDEPLHSADLRFSLETALKIKNPLLSAYALRTVQDAQLEDTKDLDDVRGLVRDSLKIELQDLLKNATNLRPVTFVSWPGYIGQRGSSIALLAHTLFNEKAIDQNTIESVRQALLNQFNGENFGSTFETGQILLHSAWLIRDEIENRRVHAAPSVFLANQKINTEAKLLLTGWEIPVADRMDTENVDIRITGASDKDRILLVGQRSAPLGEVTAIQGATYLSRKIYHLNPTTQDLRPLQTDDVLEVGDLLYVENSIKVKGGHNFFSSIYYLLENDIPTGTSLIEEDNRFSKLDVFSEKSGWNKREEINGRLIYYFDFKNSWNNVLRDGRRVGYILRVTSIGDFNSGVSRFMDFYDEENFSQSDSQRIHVVPRAQR